MSTSEPIAGSASTTIAYCSTDAQRLPSRCQRLAKGLEGARVSRHHKNHTCSARMKWPAGEAELRSSSGVR